MARRLIFASLLLFCSVSVVTAAEKAALRAAANEPSQTDVMLKAFARDVAFIRSFSLTAPAQYESSPLNVSRTRGEEPKRIPPDKAGDESHTGGSWK